MHITDEHRQYTAILVRILEYNATAIVRHRDVPNWHAVLDSDSNFLASRLCINNIDRMLIEDIIMRRELMLWR